MLYFDLIIPYVVLCLFKMYSYVCTCLVCCSFVLSKCIECMLALLNNEQFEVPKCVVGDLPEQQPGEGKCPLTYYVLHTL
jgi:hypothetical protein